jgi:flagellar biosynthetic protein FliR
VDALLIEKLLGFAMVLTRISAFFLVAPVFGWETIPMTIKLAGTLLLSFFFTLTNPPAVTPEQASTLQVMLLLGGEATYGLALGAIANILFSVVKLGGRIMEDQMGLTMAEILDPLTEERGQPLASMLEMIFVIAFLSANGHHILIRVIERSYALFPAGKIPTLAALAGNMLEATSMMLAAGLRIAAPMLAALLVLLAALAILSRIVPEMNIFFISFPLRILLGMVLLVAFVPFIGEFVGETAKLMARLLPL